ncbi:DUF982 domain-containing protein [Microvirga brassicacearum]|uniref:DUF982 domain-containing protein n=1 Tax=Microvirga brassicacearum TaxID=2580413 RepID=A0A5N3P777_9HYPH|nr:DUF982 domain-containing protein [Microvirga brassicacearum]
MSGSSHLFQFASTHGRRSVSRVDEAVEVLLYQCPKSATGDPIVRAALKACHDAMSGNSAVQNAKTAFEAAAREIGILDES